MIIKIAIALLIIYTLYLIFFKRQNKTKHDIQEDEESFISCKKCGVFVSKNSLKNGLCENCQKDK